MAQTAVQWLFDQTIVHNGILPISVVENAIAMEKKQIMEAYEQAHIDLNMSFRGADRSEQYYEGVYGE